MKPLMLLDFDGVINPENLTLDEKKQLPDLDVAKLRWDDTVETTVPLNDGNFVIRFSPTVINHINDLSGSFDIWWLTDWEEDTLKLPDVIGIKDFPFFTGRPKTVGEANGWWKFNIIKTLDTTRPTLWIDDNIPKENYWPERAWVNRHPHIETIVPHRFTGLLRKHFDEIETFLQNI